MRYYIFKVDIARFILYNILCKNFKVIVKNITLYTITTKERKRKKDVTFQARENAYSPQKKHS